MCSSLIRPCFLHILSYIAISTPRSGFQITGMFNLDNTLTLVDECIFKLYTLFSTTISGLISIRAYRAQTFFMSKNAFFLNESQGALHHRFAGQIFLRVVLSWMQTLLAVGMAVLAVLLRDSDTTSAALLGVALSKYTHFQSHF